jgi:hypothetical protein
MDWKAILITSAANWIVGRGLTTAPDFVRQAHLAVDTSNTEGKLPDSLRLQ